MQRRAAACHDAAMAGMDRQLPAVPIRDRTAGIAHDRGQCAVVERVEPAVEADIERSVRDPAIGMAAAAIDAPFRIAAQPLEGGALAGVEGLGIAVAEDRVGERRSLRVCTASPLRRVGRPSPPIQRSAVTGLSMTPRIGEPL